MTSFIGLCLLRHRLILGTQPGEYLLGRRHPPGVCVGNPASQRCVESGQSGFTFVQQTQALAQHLTF
jgi:hypothetical protein